MDKEIFDSVDQYILRLVGGEDEALRAADRSITEENLPPISVSANQGKFLNVLAKACRAKKILEIGTLAGYSTIWMARALPKDGKLISLEFDPHHARVARNNIERAGLSKIVDVRIGKAIELLPQLLANNEGPFDMIFIDADKPPYMEYFQWSLKLAHSGTLIVADNVIREGNVLDPASTDEMVQGVQRFNEYLSQTKSVTATILQTVGAKVHDGMALAVVN
ncbi:MAG TPA: O-methyltransferase, partial [Chryseolinea sp.]|nr:O-methyltransferase [Chryseolinea sp.]